ncbi:pentapeptide repeat-containing protein [Rhodococcus aetherivorans]|uniref:pentapeptide repeat-containing protein n=1 Tax=Rhodococcus aetherivorans TaxID=191292 RepID=UPI002949F85C|nr:pentapeptide repeat-containing protein [Rhodococcus aetherivorans]MDV6296951.1 pentapeptide repeat-containing protein [Rhodococcus aetherivorans]
MLTGADLAGIGRTIGLIAAAAVAVPGVVLAYRRQKSLDDSNNLKAEADFLTTEKNYDDRRDSIVRDRRTRFVSIAEQLASPALIVRLAGVAAMEALANEWLGDLDVDEDQRQREAQACVNVLCSYLRSPYEPPNGTDQPATLTKKVVKDTGTGTEEHHEYLLDDMEVRKTIARTLATHLRKITPVPSVRIYSGPWSYMNLDLAGAYFRNVNFSKCQFLGDINFSGAKFEGSYATFEDAEFSGPARFSEATFTSSRVNFKNVRFMQETWFLDTNFHSMFTDFTGIKSRYLTWFMRANFSGERIRFFEATFEGRGVLFNLVKFTDCVDVDFMRANFHAETVSMAIMFRRVNFLQFNNADFLGETDFSLARFIETEAHFEGCNLVSAKNLPRGKHLYDAKTVFPEGMKPPKIWENMEPKDVPQDG